MTAFRTASLAAILSSVEGHFPPFLRPALGRYPPRVERFNVLELCSDIDIHKSKKSKEAAALSLATAPSNEPLICLIQYEGFVKSRRTTATQWGVARRLRP